jgi:diguanylate cyclase (GGDEF)-like protein
MASTASRNGSPPPVSPIGPKRAFRRRRSLVEEPFSRAALFRAVGPLVAVMQASLLASAGGSRAHDPGAVLIAAILLVVTAGATAFAPWDRLPESAKPLPAFAYLVCGFLICIASGRQLDIGVLALLPVVWLAVYGSLWELLTLLIAVILVELAPLGMPNAPPDLGTRVFFQVGTAVTLGLVVHQVVEQIRRQAGHLASLAHRDELTAVANRRAWDEELERSAGESDRGPSPAAVAVGILDLDDFKAYNDRAGHQAGDRLLREIAARWSLQLRRSDTLARIGGDEFAVLLRGCDAAAAEEVLGRLCMGVPEGVTCSAGLATWDPHEPPQALMARADAALYRAKAAGRGRVEVWSGSRRLVRPAEPADPLSVRW